jgi:hypothetical protein
MAISCCHLGTDARGPGSGHPLREQLSAGRGPAPRHAPGAARAWLGGVLALLLTACASTGSPYSNLDRYLGSSLASVKAEFGPGFREYIGPDGRHTVTWAWQDPGTTTGYRPPVVRMGRGATSVTVGPDPSSASGSTALCEYTFFATADGTVDGWRSFGPACQGSGGSGAPR